MADSEYSNGLKQRFIALWRSCSAQADDRSAEAVWQLLLRGYGEPHRHYHDFGHIAFCLEQHDLASHLMRSPDAVELAIWFHDVFHVPDDPANEATSSALFRENAQSLDTGMAGSVASMILDTQHKTAPATDDGCYMVDIDLASLGQPWSRFFSDSEAIRQEQPDITDQVYESRQQVFLRSLMARSRLYRTRFFQDRYETAARANITRFLGGLAG